MTQLSKRAADGADVSTPPAKRGVERAFPPRLARVWRDTVGAFATDEGETKNLMRRLVEFGALSKEEASRTLADMRTRIEDNRVQLDRGVESSLRQALSRWKVPSAVEIARLRARIAELEARIQRLEQP